MEQGWPTPQKIDSSKVENTTEKPLLKTGVDFVFEQNPSLSLIGTQEQYSEYLETIFPDSKIKDIVFHEASAKTPLFNGSDWNMSGLEGAYFSFYNQHKVGNTPSKFLTKYIVPTRMMAAVVNVENPFLITKKLHSKEETQSIRRLKKRVDLSGHDALLGFANPLYDKGQLDSFPELPDSISQKNNIELAVFAAQQIHILNSPIDIEKFKEFVNSRKNQPDPHASV